MIEDAVEQVADLPFRCPLPSLDGMQIEVAGTGVLVMTPMDENEGEEKTEIYSSKDGLIERLIHHQFGLIEERRYEWRESDLGPVLLRLTRLDRSRPDEKIEYEVSYAAFGGVELPVEISMRLNGQLPHDIHFRFRYSSSY